MVLGLGMIFCFVSWGCEGRKASTRRECESVSAGVWDFTSSGKDLCGLFRRDVKIGFWKQSMVS